jgi:uncharacterized membrane protein
MTASVGARPTDRVVPAWLAPTALTVALLGLAVSAYLSYEHYTGSTTLACPASGTIDCARVTASAWSSIVGIPVAPLGLVFFVAMTVLCLPSMLRRQSPMLDVLRLGFCGVGLLMALYLLWAELFQIHAICLWCTGVHLLTFLLFATLLIGRALAEPAPRR